MADSFDILANLKLETGDAKKGVDSVQKKLDTVNMDKSNKEMLNTLQTYGSAAADKINAAVQSAGKIMHEQQKEISVKVTTNEAGKQKAQQVAPIAPASPIPNIQEAKKAASQYSSLMSSFSKVVYDNFGMDGNGEAIEKMYNEVSKSLIKFGSMDFGSAEEAAARLEEIKGKMKTVFEGILSDAPAQRNSNDKIINGTQKTIERYKNLQNVISQSTSLDDYKEKVGKLPKETYLDKSFSEGALDLIPKRLDGMDWSAIQQKLMTKTASAITGMTECIEQAITSNQGWDQIGKVLSQMFEKSMTIDSGLSDKIIKAATRISGEIPTDLGKGIGGLTPQETEIKKWGDSWKAQQLSGKYDKDLKKFTPKTTITPEEWKELQSNIAVKDNLPDAMPTENIAEFWQNLYTQATQTFKEAGAQIRGKDFFNLDPNSIEKKGKYTIMTGLPGSGKSSFTSTLPAGTKIVDMDQIKKNLFGSETAGPEFNWDYLNTMNAIKRYQVQQTLANGEDVVLDGVHQNVKARAQAISWGKDYASEVDSAVIPTPANIAVARQNMRERKIQSDAIYKSAESWSMPTTDEGFDKVTEYPNHLPQQFPAPVDTAGLELYITSLQAAAEILSRHKILFDKYKQTGERDVGKEISLTANSQEFGGKELEAWQAYQKDPNIKIAMSQVMDQMPNPIQGTALDFAGFNDKIQEIIMSQLRLISDQIVKSVSTTTVDSELLSKKREMLYNALQDDPNIDERGSYVDKMSAKLPDMNMEELDALGQELQQYYQDYFNKQKENLRNNKNFDNAGAAIASEYSSQLSELFPANIIKENDSELLNKKREMLYNALQDDPNINERGSYIDQMSSKLPDMSMEELDALGQELQQYYQDYFNRQKENLRNKRGFDESGAAIASEYAAQLSEIFSANNVEEIQQIEADKKQPLATESKVTETKDYYEQGRQKISELSDFKITSDIAEQYVEFIRQKLPEQIRGDSEQAINAAEYSTRITSDRLRYQDIDDKWNVATGNNFFDASSFLKQLTGTGEIIDSLEKNDPLRHNDVLVKLGDIFSHLIAELNKALPQTDYIRTRKNGNDSVLSKDIATAKMGNDVFTWLRGWTDSRPEIDPKEQRSLSTGYYSGQDYSMERLLEGKESYIPKSPEEWMTTPRMFFRGENPDHTSLQEFYKDSSFSLDPGIAKSFSGSNGGIITAGMFLPKDVGAISCNPPVGPYYARHRGGEYESDYGTDYSFEKEFIMQNSDVNQQIQNGLATQFNTYKVDNEIVTQALEKFYSDIQSAVDTLTKEQLTQLFTQKAEEIKAQFAAERVKKGYGAEDTGYIDAVSPSIKGTFLEKYPSAVYANTIGDRQGLTRPFLFQNFLNQLSELSYEPDSKKKLEGFRGLFDSNFYKNAIYQNLGNQDFQSGVNSSNVQKYIDLILSKMATIPREFAQNEIKHTPEDIMSHYNDVKINEDITSDLQKIAVRQASGMEIAKGFNGFTFTPETAQALANQIYGTEQQNQQTREMSKEDASAFIISLAKQARGINGTTEVPKIGKKLGPDDVEGIRQLVLQELQRLSDEKEAKMEGLKEDPRATVKLGTYGGTAEKLLNPRKYEDYLYQQQYRTPNYYQNMVDRLSSIRISGATYSEEPIQGDILSESTKTGNDVPSGFITGMKEKIPEVKATGTEVGKAGLDGLADGAQSHSDSVFGIARGNDVANGYSHAMEDGAEQAEAAGKKLGDAGLSGLISSIGSLNTTKIAKSLTSGKALEQALSGIKNTSNEGISPAFKTISQYTAADSLESFKKINMDALRADYKIAKSQGSKDPLSIFLEKQFEATQMQYIGSQLSSGSNASSLSKKIIGALQNYSTSSWDMGFSGYESQGRWMGEQLGNPLRLLGGILNAANMRGGTSADKKAPYEYASKPIAYYRGFNATEYEEQDLPYAYYTTNPKTAAAYSQNEFDPSRYSARKFKSGSQIQVTMGRPIDTLGAGDEKDGLKLDESRLSKQYEKYAIGSGISTIFNVGSGDDLGKVQQFAETMQQVARIIGLYNPVFNQIFAAMKDITQSSLSTSENGNKIDISGKNPVEELQQIKAGDVSSRIRTEKYDEFEKSLSAGHEEDVAYYKRIRAGYQDTLNNALNSESFKDFSAKEMPWTAKNVGIRSAVTDMADTLVDEDIIAKRTDATGKNVNWDSLRQVIVDAYKRRIEGIDESLAEAEQELAKSLEKNNGISKNILVENSDNVDVNTAKLPNADLRKDGQYMTEGIMEGATSTDVSGAANTIVGNNIGESVAEGIEESISTTQEASEKVFEPKDFVNKMTSMMKHIEGFAIENDDYELETFSDDLDKDYEATAGQLKKMKTDPSQFSADFVKENISIAIDNLTKSIKEQLESGELDEDEQKTLQDELTNLSAMKIDLSGMKVNAPELDIQSAAEQIASQTQKTTTQQQEQQIISTNEFINKIAGMMKHIENFAVENDDYDLKTFGDDLDKDYEATAGQLKKMKKDPSQFSVDFIKENVLLAINNLIKSINEQLESGELSESKQKTFQNELANLSAMETNLSGMKVNAPELDIQSTEEQAALQAQKLKEQQQEQQTMSTNEFVNLMTKIMNSIEGFAVENDDYDLKTFGDNLDQDYESTAEQLKKMKKDPSQLSADWIKENISIAINNLIQSIKEQLESGELDESEQKTFQDELLNLSAIQTDLSGIKVNAPELDAQSAAEQQVMSAKEFVNLMTGKIKSIEGIATKYDDYDLKTFGDNLDTDYEATIGQLKEMKKDPSQFSVEWIKENVSLAIDNLIQSIKEQLESGDLEEEEQKSLQGELTNLSSMKADLSGIKVDAPMLDSQTAAEQAASQAARQQQEQIEQQTMSANEFVSLMTSAMNSIEGVATKYDDYELNTFDEDDMSRDFDSTVQFLKEFKKEPDRQNADWIKESIINAISNLQQSIQEQLDNDDVEEEDKAGLQAELDNLSKIKLDISKAKVNAPEFDAQTAAEQALEQKPQNKENIVPMNVDQNAVDELTRAKQLVEKIQYLREKINNGNSSDWAKKMAETQIGSDSKQALQLMQKNGQYMGEGVAEGLTQADVSSPAADLVTQIEDAIKRAAGIASPAEEFKPIGMYMALGIIEGFKEANFGSYFAELIRSAIVTSQEENWDVDADAFANKDLLNTTNLENKAKAEAKRIEEKKAAEAAAAEVVAEAESENEEETESEGNGISIEGGATIQVNGDVTIEMGEREEEETVEEPSGDGGEAPEAPEEPEQQTEENIDNVNIQAGTVTLNNPNVIENNPVTTNAETTQQQTQRTGGNVNINANVVNVNSRTSNGNQAPQNQGGRTNTQTGGTQPGGGRVMPRNAGGYGDMFSQSNQLRMSLQSIARQWLGIGAAIRIVKQALNSVKKTIAELDKSITSIATVTGMSASSLWGQMDSYVAQAKAFGVSINEVYKASLLFYQQGMATNQVTTMTAETLKLAKIAGLDTSKAADYMTTAFRAFKMEMSDVNTIADTYANLAANAATSVSELSEAMTKAATTMNAVGASFENTSAFITMMIETTRETASTIGSAMSSIGARYSKLQQDPNGVKEDGDNTTVKLNDVDKALTSIGIDMQDANGQIRNMDEVILELANKWDTLDKNTQSYVATLMAGARMKSKFIALVQNSARLNELVDEANNSEDAAQLQLLRNMDSIETKTQQLQTAMQSLYTNMGIEKITKGWIDFKTAIVNSFAELSKPAALLQIVQIFTTISTIGLKIIRSIVNSFAQGGREAGQAWARGNADGTRSGQGEIQAAQTEATNNGAATNGQTTTTWGRGGRGRSAAGMAMSIAGLALQSAATQINTKGVNNDSGRGWSAFTQFNGSTLSGAGTGMMIGGPWGALAGGIIGGLSSLPSIIETLDYTLEEKISDLKETATEKKNDYTVAKGEAKEVDSLIKKLERLKSARYESNEANQEYKDYMNEIASTYPELVSAYDNEGNAIISLSQCYDKLAESASEAAAAQVDSANAGYDLVVAQVDGYQDSGASFTNKNSDTYELTDEGIKAWSENGQIGTATGTYSYNNELINSFKMAQSILLDAINGGEALISYVKDSTRHIEMKEDTYGNYTSKVYGSGEDINWTLDGNIASESGALTFDKFTGKFGKDLNYKRTNNDIVNYNGTQYLIDALGHQVEFNGTAEDILTKENIGEKTIKELAGIFGDTNNMFVSTMEEWQADMVAGLKAIGMENMAKNVEGLDMGEITLDTWKTYVESYEALGDYVNYLMENAREEVAKAQIIQFNQVKKGKKTTGGNAVIASNNTLQAIMTEQLDKQFSEGYDNYVASLGKNEAKLGYTDWVATQAGVTNGLIKYYSDLYSIYGEDFLDFINNMDSYTESEFNSKLEKFNLEDEATAAITEQWQQSIEEANEVFKNYSESFARKNAGVLKNSHQIEFFDIGGGVWEVSPQFMDKMQDNFEDVDKLIEKGYVTKAAGYYDAYTSIWKNVSKVNTSYSSTNAAKSLQGVLAKADLTTFEGIQSAIEAAQELVNSGDILQSDYDSFVSELNQFKELVTVNLNTFINSLSTKIKEINETLKDFTFDGVDIDKALENFAKLRKLTNNDKLNFSEIYTMNEKTGEFTLTVEGYLLAKNAEIEKFNEEIDNSITDMQNQQNGINGITEGIFDGNGKLREYGFPLRPVAPTRDSFAKAILTGDDAIEEMSEQNAIDAAKEYKKDFAGSEKEAKDLLKEQGYQTKKVNWDEIDSAGKYTEDQRQIIEEALLNSTTDKEFYEFLTKRAEELGVAIEEGEQIKTQYEESLKKSNMAKAYSNIDWNSILQLDNIEEQQNAIAQYAIEAFGMTADKALNFAETALNQFAGGGKNALFGASIDFGDRLSTSDAQTILDGAKTNVTNALDVITGGAGKVIDSATQKILEKAEIIDKVAKKVGNVYVTKELSQNDIAEYANKFVDNVKLLIQYGEISIKDANEQLTTIIEAQNAKVKSGYDIVKAAASGSFQLSDLTDLANSLGMTVDGVIAGFGDNITQQADGSYKLNYNSLDDFITTLQEQFGMEIANESDYYKDAVIEYFGSKSSNAQNIIKRSTEIDKNIVTQVKDLAQAGIGDQVDVSYLTAIFSDDGLKEYFDSIGAVYADGVATLTGGFKINDLISLTNTIKQDGGNNIADQLSELEDTITELINNWSSLLSKGVSGTLTNVEADVMKSNFGLTDIDFTKTANGLKLSQGAAANLYVQLKSIDSVSARITLNQMVEDIDKVLPGIRNISDMLGEIADLEGRIAKEGKNSSQVLSNQLSMYKDIAIAMRDNSDNYDLSGGKLPDSLQSGLNIWQSGYDWMNALKTAGKKNQMDVTDFYNMMTFIGDQLGDAAMSFNGQAVTAADLIEAGMGAIKTVDGKQVVDLSKLGPQFKGVDSMKSDITSGINALAESQISLLDALIGVLETVVAMEKLGELAGDDAKLDLTDMFEINAETGEITGIKESFKEWVNASDDFVEQAGKIEINGIKLSEIFKEIGEGDWTGTQNKLSEMKLSIDQFGSLMQTFYSMSLSGDYDLDNLLTSTLNQIKDWEDGVNSIAVNITDAKGVVTGTAFLQMDGSSFTIEWKDKDVKKLVEETWRDAENPQDAASAAIQKYLNGEQIDADKIEAVLKLSGTLVEKVDSETKEKYYLAFGERFESKEEAIAYAVAQQANIAKGGNNNDTIDIENSGFNENGEYVVNASLSGGLKYSYRMTDKGIKYECNGVEYNSYNEMLNGIRKQKLIDRTPGNLPAEQAQKQLDGMSKEELYQFDVENGIRVKEKLHFNLDKDTTSSQTKSDLATIKSWGKDKIQDMIDNGTGSDEERELLFTYYPSLKMEGNEANAGDVIDSINNITGIEDKTVNLTLNVVSGNGQDYVDIIKNEVLNRTLNLTLNVLNPNQDPNNPNGGLGAIDYTSETQQLLSLASAAASVDQIDFSNFETLKDVLQEIINKLQTINNTKINPGSGSQPTDGNSGSSGSSGSSGNSGGNSGSSAGAASETVTTAQIDTSSIETAATAVVNNLTAMASAANSLPVDASTSLENAAGSLQTVSTNAIVAASSLQSVIDKLGKLVGSYSLSIGASVDVSVSVSGGTQTSPAKGTLKNASHGGGTQSMGSNSVSWSFAKGGGLKHGVAGKGSLMGELGPEIVVTGGHYYTVGQNGAEFVDLPADAIIFNHLQTKKLIENGSINSTGDPLFSENRSVAMATGNVSGDAFASAASALAALKQLRAMWAQLSGVSAKDLAGTGGGGGGGGGGGNDEESAAYVADLNRWYNLEQQIARIEKTITTLEKERATYVKATADAGYQYATNLKASLDYTNKELEKQRELKGLVEDYYDKRVETLDASNPYGNFLTLDRETGAIQYIDDGFKELADLQEKDANGKNKLGSGKNQLQEIKKYFGKIYGAGTQEYKDAVNALNYKGDGTKAKNDEERVQVFWDNIDAWKAELESYQQKLDETNDAIADLEKTVYEVEKELRDNELSLEQLLLTAMTDKIQAEIDALQDNADAIKEASENYVNGLKESLDKEKAMYDAQKNDADLTKKQRQLAILQRTGGSASEIKALQDEINSSLQDKYFEEQQAQIDAIQESVDKQLDALQKQIDLQTEALEYSKKNGLYWEEIRNMMETRSEGYLTNYIRENTAAYQEKSALDLATQIDETDQKAIQEYLATLKELEDPLNVLQKELQENDYSDEEIKSIINAYTSAYGKTSGENGTDNARKGAGEKAAADARASIDEKNKKASDWEKYRMAAIGAGGDIKEIDANKEKFMDLDQGKRNELIANAESIENQVKSADYVKAKEKIYKFEDNKISEKLFKESTGSAKNGKITEYVKIVDAVGKRIALAKSNDTSKILGWKESESLANAWRKLQEKGSLTAFATGGKVDFTGPAWLDGTKTKPEAVLSAKDYELLKSKIFSDDKFSLRSTLEALTEFTDSMSNASSGINNDNGITFENVNLTIEGGVISSDYDAQRAGQNIMDEMLKIARKNGNLTLTRR